LAASSALTGKKSLRSAQTAVLVIAAMQRFVLWKVG
jgi:hypothetical protein